MRSVQDALGIVVVALVDTIGVGGGIVKGETVPTMTEAIPPETGMAGATVTEIAMAIAEATPTVLIPTPTSIPTNAPSPSPIATSAILSV